MRYLLFVLSLFFLSSCSLYDSKPDKTPRFNYSSSTIAFQNGAWLQFNENSVSFTKRELYSVNGIFTDKKPNNIDTVINVENLFLIPPFGDAHNHAFADGYSVRFSKNLFLKQGIFYALNLTNPYTGALSVKENVNIPGAIDVAYSHGGISTSKGSRPHPAFAMERVYGYLVDDTTKTWPLEGNAYWFMESEEQIHQKWSQIKKQNPDIIKVYIMLSGRSDSNIPECGYGLCEEELEVILDSARAINKRVFAHVNTANDFQLALDVGVDGIAHLPLGNDGLTIEDAEPLTLADSTIQQAGEMGIILTPTAHLLSEDLEGFLQDTLQNIISLQRAQLKKLHQAGVKIALGTDGWDDDPTREAMHLHAYEVFSNKELLKIWTRTTPEAIFPDRKFGTLNSGYEASFIGLECNPIEDFKCTQKIELLVKQGEIIR